MHLTVSGAGVRFNQHWEGFSKHAVDIGDGAVTIGFGSTNAVRVVHLGDTISRMKARRWLIEELGDLVQIIPKRRRMHQQADGPDPQVAAPFRRKPAAGLGEQERREGAQQHPHLHHRPDIQIHAVPPPGLPRPSGIRLNPAGAAGCD